MLTIEEVSETLQKVLTEDAHEAGQASGMIQRERKLNGASFVQTLVFGWMANPEASLEELSQAAATCGVEISAQGIDGRFNAKAATCLKMVLEKSLTYALESEGSRSDVIGRFAGVYLQDSTVIGLPIELAGEWAAGGNQHGRGAGLKVQTMLDYQNGRLTFSLHPACNHDSPLQTVDLPAGALRLADTGYFDVDCLASLSEQGVFWLTRVPAKVRVWDEAGRKWKLSEWLAAHQVEGCVDGWVTLTAKGLKARLLAQLAPADVAAQRRQQLLPEAKRRGRSLTPELWELCAWSFCVTNLPPDQLTFHEAFALLRVRWQIELLFKLWKSDLSLSSSRSAHPWRILCEIYAKLLIVVIQHWLLLIGCWDLPQRSLVKAGKTLRKHAFHLAAVLFHPSRLALALHSICLALSRCRVQKRKACPATFQRLESLPLS
jgi:hypothetical protein